MTSSAAATFATMFRCVSTTPLGSPVVPEVKMTSATSSPSIGVGAMRPFTGAGRRRIDCRDFEFAQSIQLLLAGERERGLRLADYAVQ